MRENTSCRVWEISAIGFTELRPEGDFTTETRRTQSSEWILNWPEVMASAVVTPSRTPNSEPRTPNSEPGTGFTTKAQRGGVRNQMLVLALEGHRDQWDRIWCVPFVRPASSGHRFFSQSIPPSKTKYRLIAFRARVRPVRGSLSEGGARLIREAKLFSENPGRKTRFDRLRTPNPELRTPNPKLQTPNSKPPFQR